MGWGEGGKIKVLKFQSFSKFNLLLNLGGGGGEEGTHPNLDVPGLLKENILNACL